MKNSPFKLTYYFGLLTFSIPVFLFLLASIFTITHKRKDESYETPKKIIETKIVTKIVYDTVRVEKPKQKSSPKIVVEPKKVDTNIVRDSL